MKNVCYNYYNLEAHLTYSSLACKSFFIKIKILQLKSYLLYVRKKQYHIYRKWEPFEFEKTIKRRFDGFSAVGFVRTLNDSH